MAALAQMQEHWLGEPLELDQLLKVLQQQAVVAVPIQQELRALVEAVVATAPLRQALLQRERAETERNLEVEVAVAVAPETLQVKRQHPARAATVVTVES
jgi:hypothetical protein